MEESERACSRSEHRRNIPMPNMAVRPGFVGSIHNCEEIMSFDKVLEKAPHSAKKSLSQEPKTLEISYLLDDGSHHQEVVFEDPAECHKAPRLLVSLKSVLALKELVEREFGRVEVLANMLHSCRCAYFKELLWLREQLLLAARPNQEVLIDAVKSYEVYWYEPRQYVNEELREFLQDCIRHTNRKLIEENYELQMKLGGKSWEDNEDAEATLRRALKKFGPAKLIKGSSAVVTSKNGSKEWAAEFQAAIGEVASTLGWTKGAKTTVAGDPEAMKKLQDEVEALREQVRDVDFLKTRVGQLSADAENARTAAAKAEAALDAEIARAKFEQERADAERRRAEELETLLAGAQKKTGGNRDEYDKLRAAADRASERIMTCVSSLQRMRTFAGAPSSQPASPSVASPHVGLETASHVLEELVHHGSNSEADDVVKKLQLAADRLQAKVQSLEEQLKKALEAESKAKEDADKARLHAEAAERAARASGAQISNTADTSADLNKALKRAERAEKQVQDLTAQVEEKVEEMQSLKKEIAKLKKELAASGKDTMDADLEAELRKKIQELEDANDAMAARLVRAQDKIKDLKEEVKTWKRKCGVEVNSDDENEESEDDLPDFLISYAKRNRYRVVPRWAMLSEDATLSRMKREWLVSTKPSDLGAAFSAFDFLRMKPNKRREHLQEAGQSILHQYALPPCWPNVDVQPQAAGMHVHPRALTSAAAAAQSAAASAQSASRAAAVKMPALCVDMLSQAPMDKTLDSRFPGIRIDTSPARSPEAAAASHRTSPKMHWPAAFATDPSATVASSEIFKSPALGSPLAATSPNFASTNMSPVAAILAGVPAHKVQRGSSPSGGELPGGLTLPKRALHRNRTPPSRSLSPDQGAPTIPDSFRAAAAAEAVAAALHPPSPTKSSVSPSAATTLSRKFITTNTDFASTSRSTGKFRMRPSDMSTSLATSGTDFACTASSMGGRSPSKGATFSGPFRSTALLPGGKHCTSPTLRSQPNVDLKEAAPPPPALDERGAPPVPSEAMLVSSSPKAMRRIAAAGQQSLGSRCDPFGASRGEAGVSWGRSRSMATLPVTNASVGSSPSQAINQQLPRSHSPSKAHSAARLGAPQQTVEEGFAPELLPPLPQGRVKKTAPPPSWLIPTG